MFVTSIKFKKNPKKFLLLCYSIFFLSLIMVGYSMELNKYFFILLSLAFIQLFYLQIKKLNIQSASSCLNAFKSNNFLGTIIFVAIIIGKF